MSLLIQGNVSLMSPALSVLVIWSMATGSNRILTGWPVGKCSISEGLVSFAFSSTTVIFSYFIYLQAYLFPPFLQDSSSYTNSHQQFTSYLFKFLLSNFFTFILSWFRKIFLSGSVWLKSKMSKPPIT